MVFQKMTLDSIRKTIREKWLFQRSTKPKGLEWDRVYLLSVNNYDFPSMQDYDRYISEKWFVRQNLNLEAEVLSLLEAVSAKDMIGLKEE